MGNRLFYDAKVHDLQPFTDGSRQLLILETDVHTAGFWMMSKGVDWSCSMRSTASEVCGENLLANSKHMPASSGCDASEQTVPAALPRLLEIATALIGYS